VEPIRRLLAAVDDFQQRHRWLAFPFAVVKKFGDDQAGRHAALLAYYGFFSLFPLLLVAVTVIGFILQGRSDLADRIVDSTAAQFPIVGTSIAKTVEGSHLRGSGVALVIGAAFAVWGGLGVADAAQAAMNGIWNVPRRRYPNFFLRRLRGLAWLVLLGGGLLAASVAAGFAHAAGGAWSGIAGAAASAVVNTCLFLVGFRVLTVRNVSLRSLLPGAVLAALAWALLQWLGGWYVNRQLTHATNTYGTFALVIGLLSWLYLAATVTLYAAELNAVLARGLWPRSLAPPPLGPADEQVLEDLAKQEERRPEQRVEVSFDAAAEPAEDGQGQEPEPRPTGPAQSG